MQIITLKATTRKTFRINVVNNCAIFPQIIRKIVPFAQHFLPIKFFFKCGFKNLCFQLPQIVPWTDEMTRVISASTGLNEVSLAHHIF